MRASSAEFYDYSDKQLCSFFGDRFFTDIETVFDTQHSDYATIFFKNLSPAFLSRYSDVDKYQRILSRIENTNNTIFIKLIKDDIELITEVLKVKAKSMF